jgi:hypothetical protein
MFRPPWRHSLFPFFLPSAPSVAGERIQVISVHVGLGIRTSVLSPRPSKKTKTFLRFSRSQQGLDLFVVGAKTLAHSQYY